MTWQRCNTIAIQAATLINFDFPPRLNHKVVKTQRK
jgi:hypothetical protein